MIKIKQNFLQRFMALVCFVVLSAFSVFSQNVSLGYTAPAIPICQKVSTRFQLTLNNWTSESVQDITVLLTLPQGVSVSKDRGTGEYNSEDANGYESGMWEIKETISDGGKVDITLHLTAEELITDEYINITIQSIGGNPIIATGNQRIDIPITVQPEPEISVPSISICDNEATVDLTDEDYAITPVGGTFSLSYGGYVTHDGTFDVAEALAAGEDLYTITYTAAECGTYKDFTIKITEVPKIEFDAQALCKDGDALNLANILTAASTGGGTFSGTNVNSNGEAPPVFTFNPETATIGANTVTYTTELNECTRSKNTTITVNSPPELTVENLSTCPSEPVNLTQFAAENEGLDLTYWTDAEASIQLANPDVVLGGTYYIKATDPSTTCFVIEPVEVTIKPAPELLVDNTITVCEPETVDLTLFEDENNDYTLTYWKDAAATATEITTPTAIAESNTYYIKGVNNSTSCSVIEAIEVTINELPNLVITEPAPVCFPNTVDLTAAGVTTGTTPDNVNLTYWTSDNAAPETEISTPDAVAGTRYYIKATDPSTNCFVIEPVSVTINSLPTAAIAYEEDSYCATGTAEVTLTDYPGGSYSSTPGLSIDEDSGEIDLAASTPATYTVIYSFNDGTCSNTATFDIKINPLPTAAIKYTGSPYCATGTAEVTLTGQEGGTYTSTTGLVINGTTGTIDLAASTPGTYTVTYSFSDGTCSSTATTEVSINPLPTITFDPILPVCENVGTTINLRDYQVTPPAKTAGTFTVITDVVDADGIFNPAEAEAAKITYVTFTYTDNNTCRDSVIIPVEVFAKPTVTLNIASSKTKVTCNGDENGKLVLGATGGSNTYPSFCISGGTAWQGAENSATKEFSNLPPGDYLLCVKDSRGCVSDKLQQIITEPSEVEVRFAETSDTVLTCHGAADGVIEIIAEGGNGSSSSDYQYTITIDDKSWKTSGTFSGLLAGAYSVQVKDKEGCVSESIPVTIEEPGEFDAGSIAITGETLCPGETPQEIPTIDPTNTVGTVTFQWHKTIGEVSTLIPGSNAANWTPDISDIKNEGNSNLVITYTRFVSDGCTTTEKISTGAWTVTVKPTPAKPTVSNHISCPTDNSETTAWASLVTGNNANLIWYATKESAAIIEPTAFDKNVAMDRTSYWVSQTVDGCESERTEVVVQISDSPEAPTIHDYEKCALESGNAISLNSLVSSDGIKLWYADEATAIADTNGTDIAPTFDPTVAQAQNSYWLRVKDEGNCVSLPHAVLVTVKELPKASLVEALSSLEITCFGEETGVIEVSATGGSGSGFEYSVNDGADWNSGNQFSELGAGTYYLRVKDSEGCESMSGTVPVKIEGPDEFTAGAISATGEEVCAKGIPQLEITVATPASGGVAPVIYEWYKKIGSVTTRIEGATSATYTPPAADMENNGTTDITITYTRRAKDAVCTANYEQSAGEWKVTVKPLPVIEMEIEDAEIATSGRACAETEIMFRANRSGMAPYTWDYTTEGATVVAGGATTDDFIILKWSTNVEKDVEVTVFYDFTDTENNGCATIQGVSDVQGKQELTIRPLPVIEMEIDDDDIAASGEACAETEITFRANRRNMAPYTWNYTTEGVEVVAGGTENDYFITLKWSTDVKKDVEVYVFYKFTDIEGNSCGTVNGVSDVQGKQQLTINPLPEINIGDNANLIANGNQICAEAEIEFTTEAGMTDYAWEIDGGTVTAGATDSNTVTVKWTTPGTKTVSVFYEFAGGNGCETKSGVSDATQEVIVKPLPEIVIDNNAELDANGNQICAEAEIEFTTEAGMTDYAWEIDGGTVTAGATNSNTVTVKWTTPGTKTVSVFYEFAGGNGCETKSGVSDATQEVIVNPLPEINITNNASLAANGNQICAEAEVTFITEEGMTDYVWSIDGGTVTAGATNSNTVTVKWTTPGTKTVSVFYEFAGGNGCETQSGVSDATQEVIVKPLPEINIGDNANLTANGNQICAEAEIEFTTEAGMTDYAWEIDGGTVTAGATDSNTVTVKWTTPGTKTVSVFYEFAGGNGCETKSGVSDATQEVIVNPLPEIVIDNNAELDANGNQICAEAEIEFTTEAGMTDYAWEIDGGTVTAGATDSNTVTVKWTTPGTKTVSVFYEFAGSNGCETKSGVSDATQEVIVKPLPEIVIDNNAELDANGNQICAEAEITFTTAAGKSDYNWSIDGGTVTAGDINSNTVTVKWSNDTQINQEKTVSVFYTDVVNGCTTVSGVSTATQTVIVKPLPKIIIDNDADLTANGNQICAEAEIEFTTEPGMTNYAWEIDGGTVTAGATDSNTVTVKWTTPGTKTVSVFYEFAGGNGCEVQSGVSDATQEVIVKPLPEIVIDNNAELDANGNQICAEAEITFTTTAGKSDYNWSIDGGTVTAGDINSNTVTVKWSNDTQINREKTVSVFYTDVVNGCTTVSGVSDAAQTVIVKPLPKIAIGNDANLAANGNEVCAEAEITFTTEEGMSGYVWEVGDDGIIIGAGNRSSITVKWTTPGTKTVSVFYNYEGSNGCSTNADVSAATQEVILNPLLECEVLNAIILSQRNSNYGKNNGSVEIEGIYGTAPYQYSIDGGEFGNSGLFENLAPGEYLLTVKDAENDTHSIYVVIDEGEPSDLSGIILSKTDSKANAATGSVEVMAIRGTAPYEYSIDGGQTFQSSGLFENLAAGDYVITIRDALGDTFDLKVRINTIGDTDLQGIIVNQENSDEDVPNGMVEVAGVNGTAPYQYSIDGGEFGNSGLFETLAPGNYIVTVKDAAGNTVDVPVTIGIRPKYPHTDLSGILLMKQNTIRGKATGKLEVAGRFGTRPYEYSIDGGEFQHSGLFDNLPAGDYIIIVKDAADDTYEMIVRIDETGDCLDVVIQKGNSTLVVNNNEETNGGYTFTSYEWFKTEVAVDDHNLGKNLGYFYDSDNHKKGRNLDFGAEYYAIVIDSEGVLHQTCPIYPEEEAEASIKLYPTPLRASEYVNVKLEGFNWQETEIMLYSINGSLQSRTKATGDITPVPVPNVPGSYIVKIISGTQIIEKIIMRD